MAKSRLAPLKTVTIPRMELSAAVLATRLDQMIEQELSTPVHSSTFWADSTCVLRYIENKDKRFQTFVANRISALLNQSTAAQWRYVDTSLNPADEASRGMTVEGLLNNERRTQGPEFLKQSEEEWPRRPPSMGEIPADDPEVKKTAETFANEINKQQEDNIGKVFERFSSWTRLTRIIAWSLRYKSVLRRQAQQRKSNEKVNLQSNTDEITPVVIG